MSLHTREQIFGFGAIPEIPPIEAVKISAAQLGDWMPMFQPLSFPPPSLRSLSALRASDRSSIGPLGLGSQHMRIRADQSTVA